MKKRKNAILLMILLSALVLGGCSGKVSSDGSYSDEDSAGNRFEMGKDVSVSGSNLDLFAFGLNVEIEDSETYGNMFVFGNDTYIANSEVEADVFVAGNKIGIDNVYSSANVYAAGSSVEITDIDACAVKVGAGDISASGECYEASLSGDKVFFDLDVDGDVTIEANEVKIGDNAHVSGNLTIKAEKNPKDAEDIVDGDYSFSVKTNDDAEDAAKKAKAKAAATMASKIKNKLLSRIYWIFAYVLIGFAYFLFFDKNLTEAGAFLKTKTGAIIGLGIGTFLLVPIASFILCCFGIGAPLAAVLMAAYIVVLCLGSSFSAAALARLIVPKGNKYLTSAIGMLAVLILDIIPIIGFLASMLLDMFMLGYVALKIGNNRNKEF